MKRKIPPLIIMLSCCMTALSQNLLTVTGEVRSATDNQLLPGVNVIIKDTSLGTSTDSNGRYSLKTQSSDVLVFSFIGYATAKFAVNGQAVINVAINEDASTLGEVTIVSTGYEKLPKERANGSFVQIDQQLVNRRVGTDVLSRLEDVTSGLVFNKNIPGKRNDISIRGMSTINSNAQPLIVIDNFPYDGDINTLNPNDVESITVLKDAAAASIWGARAGNGVIVITTKKGRNNQAMKVSFNSNLTITQRPDLFYLPRMSSSEFIDVEQNLFSKGFYKAVETSVNKAPLTPAVELMIANRDGLLDNNELTAQLNELRGQDVRNDYQDYLYRNSTNQQYALNLSGGAGSNNYYFSAGWDKNLESLVGNDYNRVTLNFSNTWLAIKEKLTVSTALYFSDNQRHNSGIDPATIFSSATSPLYPYAKLRDGDGNNLPVIKDFRQTFVQQAQKDGLLNWQYSPLDEVEQRDNRIKVSDYRINAAINYKIFDGLSADVLYQYWKSAGDTRDLRKENSYFARDLINRFTRKNGTAFVRPIPLGGIVDLNTTRAETNYIRGQLNYTKSIGDHEVNALAGYEVKELNTNSATFRYYGYNDELSTNQSVDYITLFPQYFNPARSARIQNVDRQSSLTDRFVSYYGNFAYTFKRRYTISGSGRKDQSNLFGVDANQRGVPLWSAGLGWVATQEHFLHSEWLQYLKVRTTYGFSGNVNKSVSAYTTSLRVGNDFLSGQPYAVISNPPNNNLRWERVKMWNFGIDFETKNRTFSGSIEFYQKRGLDLIGATPYAPSSGITTFTGNTANTRGHGIDVVLNTNNIDRTLKWNTSFLFSNVSEKVTGYEVKDAATNYILYGNGASGIVTPLEGKPLYSLYSYASAGLDPETGNPRSYLAGTPSSDYASIVSQTSAESMIYNGPARPTVFGSLRNTIAWRNISLSINISYRLGYYFRRNSVTYSNVLSGIPDYGDYSERWQNPGDEQHTIVPSQPEAIDYNRDNIYRYSDALVEKGDHIRFQDINLSYTLDKTQWNKMPFSRIQLYTYLNNIGILWKSTQTAIDPDYPILKPSRSIAFGIRLDL